jgi:hypothetical protein
MTTVYEPQCMCGDVAVGAGCNPETCGLDAGAPDGGDGGACQCVLVPVTSDC